MIIMFEGVDGSGKTTLKKAMADRLKQLAKIKNVEIEENGHWNIPTIPNKEYRINATDLINKLTAMANDETTVYLCDRGPLSDIIYRAFDEYEPVIDLKTLWTLWLSLQAKWIIVFCDSDEAIHLMLARGEDNPVAVLESDKLRYLYKQIAPLFNIVPYDVKVQGKDMLPTINTVLARLWTHANYKDNNQIKNMIKEVEEKICQTKK